MAVEIDISYEGDLRCVATHGPSRDRIATDAPLDNGGRGAAFSPTDLIATGLGTCIVTVMDLAAKRAGFTIGAARAHVTKEMTRTGLRRVAELKVTLAIPEGKGFSSEQRAILERAAQMCPVKQSLHPDVSVVIDFHYE